jgi:serine/threonine protein kinase
VNISGTANTAGVSRRPGEENMDSPAEHHDDATPSLRPSDLLVRWPKNAGSEQGTVSRLFEDYQRRCAQAAAPVSAADVQRCPAPEDHVAHLSQCHEFVRSLNRYGAVSGPAQSLPKAGDDLFGYRLGAELGRGSFARVFLATQNDLADRPVVLKVSDLSGDEPQTLARLPHAHIVPIHSVHEDARSGLRAVCMPYYGGASLARVLAAVWADDRPPQRAGQLAHALEQVQGPPVGGTGAPTVLWGRGSYLRACCWIVARLAEGLQHAHASGILHRDLKPSNILLSADGRPMLLDFNLAHRIENAPEPALASMGGTIAYMAPEHLRALHNPSAVLARPVDHRSDLFSLGMVLIEMLTGSNPYEQQGSYSPIAAVIEAMAVERSRAAPSLRQHRPDAPWGLESILRKCLDPLPENRYQHAEQLADDLNRFLDHRPLRYAPELSRAERGRKWLRRNPRRTWAGVAAAILLLVTAGTVLAHVHRQAQHLRAWEYYKLGWQDDQKGWREQAIANYSMALACNPDHAAARLNRGLAFAECWRYAEALQDLDQVTDAELQLPNWHAGRGMALEGLGHTKEADMAFAEAFGRLESVAPSSRQRILLSFGFAMHRRRPEASRQAFATVLALNPKVPEALYGLAMLAACADRPTEAVELLDRAIMGAPGFMEAHRHRAIQLARCKQFASAFKAINWCLEREPNVGATLYAAACVASRSAEQARGTVAGAAATAKAIELLKRAFDAGHGHDGAADDPDLAVLREHAAFQRLLE